MKKLILIICILWAAVIFYNSYCSGDISQERSLSITRLIISEQQKITRAKAAEVSASKDKPFIKNKFYPQSNEESTLNFYIRKNAHALEYMVLAFLVGTVFSKFNIKNMDKGIYIMFVCLLCAALDEFLQKFSPGRTSSVGDVLIDFCGSIIGLILFYIMYYGGKARDNVK